MGYEKGLRLLTRAVEILHGESASAKQALLTAYASQLSQIVARVDLPPELAKEFLALHDIISDADMPYGLGERAAQRIEEMSDTEAAALAARIESLRDRLATQEGAPAT